MDKKLDILKEADRRSGMTVPENYFGDFARMMAEKLPEKPSVQQASTRRTFWQRSRPYVYMAAMFAGIWCMMKMFSLMGNGSTDLSIDNYPGVITALNNDNFVKDYIYPAIDEYDMIEDMMNEGISPDEFFGFDDETSYEGDNSYSSTVEFMSF